MSVTIQQTWNTLMTDNDKKLYKELGERVCKKRKEQGLTQVQLAQMLDISQQMMAAHELGTRRMPVALLVKLSKILDLTVEELLGRQEKPKKRGPASLLSQRMEQIRSLPRTRQKFVIEMIDTVISQQQS